MFKTKKAARQAGYRSESELSRSKLAIRHGAEPTIVKGESFFSPDQCERLLSRTAARQIGLRIPAHAEPVGWLSHRVGQGGAKTVTYAVYRESVCLPITRRIDRPAKIVDLLVAIFAVNKSAKRYRDAAQLHYEAGQHGFRWKRPANERAALRIEGSGHRSGSPAR